jgi:AcrR family transcriptional regulator
MKSQAESRTPRQRYRDTLRREILDAAREVFLKDGYAGVSVRKLAEAVGCSHGNLYLHFKDKEALFDCLVEEAFEEFGASLDALSQSVRQGDPVEGIRRMGRAYVAFGLSNPSAYEFAFVLRRPGQQRQQPHLPYERLQSLVQRCVDDKRLRCSNIDVASQSLWAAAHGITSLLILRPGFPWAERDKLIEQVIDAAVDGLLA